MVQFSKEWVNLFYVFLRHPSEVYEHFSQIYSTLSTFDFEQYTFVNVFLFKDFEQYEFQSEYSIWKFWALSISKMNILLKYNEY